MSNDKPAYQELEARLAEAEAIVNALRHAEVDAIVGEEHVALVRLREVEEALQKSEARFRGLAQTATDAIITTAPDGRIRFFNPAAERIFGYSAEEVTGQAVTILIPMEYRGRHRAAMQRCLETGQPTMLDQTVELKGRRKGGEVFPLELSLSATPMNNEIIFTGIIRDITERKQAEETLQRYADRLEALHEASLSFSQLLSPEAVGQKIIEALERLLDWRRGSIWVIGESGQKLHLLAHSDMGLSPEALQIELAHVRSLVTQLGEGISGWVALHGEPVRCGDVKNDPRYIEADPGIQSELCVPLKVGGRTIGALNVESFQPNGFSEHDERLLTTLASQAAVALENARLFEQVRASRERLQALSRRLVQVQEAERRHLARELHDEIGQALTGLKITLETTLPRPMDTTARDSLTEMQGQLSDLMTRVNELSLDLRPAVLDDLGLLPALVWLLQRYTSQTGVQVAFRHAGVEKRRFAPGVETAAYRIVQEALTNVARHGGVDQASVQLRADQQMLWVQVQDQGAGFDPEAALAAPDSSGLAGMYERAALLSGQLTIDAAPGAGACVTAKFPLSGRLERRDNDRDDDRAGR